MNNHLWIARLASGLDLNLDLAGRTKASAHRSAIESPLA